MYIIKGFRDIPINIILKHEELVVNRIYTSHVIRQGIENITKDGIKIIGLPPTIKYDSMNRYFSFRHRINFLYILEMRLKILAAFIGLGISQEITK